MTAAQNTARLKRRIDVAALLSDPALLVIGARDMEASAVSVHYHPAGPQGTKPRTEVVAKILADIKERRT